MADSLKSISNLECLHDTSHNNGGGTVTALPKYAPDCIILNEITKTPPSRDILPPRAHRALGFGRSAPSHDHAPTRYSGKRRQPPWKNKQLRP